MLDLRNEEESELLLGLASYRAACCLGLKHSEVKQVLQSRLGETSQSESDIQYKNCLLFIRMCRALDGVFCGNLQEEQEWLSDESTILNGIPKQLMKSSAGLKTVVSYLEGLLQHGEMLEQS